MVNPIGRLAPSVCGMAHRWCSHSYRQQYGIVTAVEVDVPTCSWVEHEDDGLLMHANTINPLCTHRVGHTPEAGELGGRERWEQFRFLM